MTLTNHFMTLKPSSFICLYFKRHFGHYLLVERQGIHVINKDDDDDNNDNDIE